MKRAIKFYENIFNQAVSEKDTILSVFNIKNFRFCLFANEQVNESVKYGDNCLPSFEVSNINLFVEKLKSLKIEIVFPLTRINNNWVLEFKDSEGNDIEVYSKI
jgi:predicted enzyme related to lactoylglutathione lyase